MTKEFGTKTTIEDSNKSVIAQLFTKGGKGMAFDVQALADSLCVQAQRYRDEVVGFGDRPDVHRESVKDFGKTNGAIEDVQKVLRFMVADNTTIEYPNEEGVPELYTFPEESLADLGKKLEGVPVVVGNGHDADLPLAYFTKDFEVEKTEDGRVELYVNAKMREDADSPIDFEALIQNPQWNVNGGGKQLSGSLRFDSFDVPYFFENGSKINFMTRAVPRHYALVDIPHIAASGLVEKNFSKEGVIMTNETEITAEVIAEATTEDVALDTPTEEVKADEAPAVEAETVDEEVKAEEAPEEEVEEVEDAEEAVEDSEVGALKARIAEVEAELAKARKNELINKILVKGLGADYTAEQADKFVEANLKSFGEGELKGFLAGIGGAVGPAKKDLGRGKLDTETAKGSAPKLTLSYLKDKKVN